MGVRLDEFLDIDEEDVEDRKPEKETTPHFELISSPGTKIYSGIIAEEYNKDLIGNKERCEYYEKMRKALGPIRAAMQVYELPLQGMTWHVKPHSDDPVEKEKAAFGEFIMLKCMRRPFRQILEDVVWFLTTGHVPFEKLDQKVDWEYTDEGGKKKIVRGMIAPLDLCYIDPKTITRWLHSDKDGSLVGVEQSAVHIRGQMSDYKTLPIPIENLLLFTHEKRGNNHEGVSLMRAMVRHYKAINQLMNYEMVGADKFALGTPWLKEPENKQVSPKARAAAKAVIKHLRSHQEGGMLIPGGWEGGILGGETGIADRFIHNSIKEHVAMILISVLAEFLLLGIEGRGGAYALDEEKKDFFSDALRKIALLILETFEWYFVRAYLDLNYNTTTYPTLILDRLGAKNLTKWADDMCKLTTAQLVQPNFTMQKYTAQKYELPEPEEGFLFPAKAGGFSPSPFDPPALSEIFKNNTLFQLAEKGVSQDHIDNLRQQKQALREKTAKALKPRWDAMRKAVAAQIDKGVEYDKLAVPEKVRLDYKQILKEAFLEGETMGGSAVAKELKKKVGNAWIKNAERKAEIEAEGLSKKDAQDTVYFALHELARRVGRNKEAV